MDAEERCHMHVCESNTMFVVVLIGTGSPAIIAAIEFGMRNAVVFNSIYIPNYTVRE